MVWTKLRTLFAGARQSTPAPDDQVRVLPSPMLDRMLHAIGITALIWMLATGIVVTMLLLWMKSQLFIQSTVQMHITSDLVMHSQRIGKAVPNALQGNYEAFNQLEESRGEFSRGFNLLVQGGIYQEYRLLPPTADMQGMIKGIEKVWWDTDQAAMRILQSRNELTTLGDTIKRINLLLPDLLDMGEFIARKQQGGMDQNIVNATARLILLTSRLSWSMDELIVLDMTNSQVNTMFEKDLRDFYTIVNGALGNHTAQHQQKDVRDKVAQMNAIFTQYRALIQPILADLPKFSAAKQAAQQISLENETLKDKLTRLVDYDREQLDSHPWTFWPMQGAILFSLLCAMGIARIRWTSMQQEAFEADLRREEADMARRHAQQQEEKAMRTNDENAQAILLLTNELQKVAAGDLTVHITMSDNIARKIADAVNHTINALRVLVGRTTQMAEDVTTATAAFGHDFNRLIEISRQQSEGLRDTEAAIQDMAGHINEVSRSAGESANVARQSVIFAKRGTKAVENTVKGMHEIREQIQETSKRIKRLGDSSLEIGEITDLISDITEQTNVLALNAAIQAASAGEAGRGFTVVAEEVQRLAERSSAATRQIGALVKTIQVDTHDAVLAMEKSTIGVVEGARLSDAAGEALSDIHRVSTELAEMIGGIATATQAQVAFATDLTHTMQRMLAENMKIGAGREQFRGLYDELDKVAKKLKESVSRFRVTIVS